MNIHGIPKNKNSKKSYDMIRMLKKWNLDVWGQNETNIIWHNVPTNHQWKDRMKNQGMYQSTFANNRHESLGSATFLPGGVSQTTTKELSGRIIEHGNDDTGLGRWTWQKYQGKFDSVLRIITFYRPCKGETQDVEYSLCTYAQHKRYFDNEHIEPRERFLQDLSDFIQECLDKNEKVVVMGDLNEDVRNTSYFSNLGLQEAITSKFKYPPPTYNRSTQFSRPIDGIWTTPDIIIKKCGYSAFDENSLSDHRLIWMDIDFSSALGCPWNMIPRSKPRRLKCSDPRLVKRYNKLVKDALQEENLFDRIKKLFELSKKGWNKTLEHEYNRIYQIQKDIRIRVEKNRKLNTGGVPWSQNCKIPRQDCTMVINRQAKKENPNQSYQD